MDMKSFLLLRDKVAPLISRQHTLMRPSVSSEERLAVTLCYLATGCLIILPWPINTQINNVHHLRYVLQYYLVYASHWSYGVEQCFQPFCCRGTLHKREDHSRNPMQWSVSPATYARMRLWGVYGLISLAGHWGQSRHEDDKTNKDDQYKIWPH